MTHTKTRPARAQIDAYLDGATAEQLDLVLKLFDNEGLSKFDKLRVGGYTEKMLTKVDSAYPAGIQNKVIEVIGGVNCPAFAYDYNSNPSWGELINCDRIFFEGLNKLFAHHQEALPAGVKWILRFDAEIGLERSITPKIEKLGMAVNVMHFYEMKEGHMAVDWEVEFPDGDGMNEGIGMWFDGKELTDYDGVFSLPEQLIEFMEGKGFDMDYAK